MDATWIITTVVLIDTVMTNLGHIYVPGFPIAKWSLLPLLLPSILPIIIGLPSMSCTNYSIYQDQSAIHD